MPLWSLLGEHFVILVRPVLNAVFRLKVPKQAFVEVDQAKNPVLGYGLNGIVGLGFTSLSNIDYAVNETSSDAGRSLLYNLFAVNPSEPNFLAFSLLRSTDSSDEVEGSFSIGMMIHQALSPPLILCHPRRIRAKVRRYR